MLAVGRDAAQHQAEEAAELAQQRASEAEKARSSAAEARAAERAALDAVVVAESERGLPLTLCLGLHSL